MFARYGETVESHPLISRWRNDLNLATVPENHGVRYLPITQVAYLQVVDEAPRAAYPDWRNFQNVSYSPLFWDAYLPEEDLVIPRPMFERNDSWAFRSKRATPFNSRNIYLPSYNREAQMGNFISTRESYRLKSRLNPRPLHSEDLFFKRSSPFSGRLGERRSRVPPVPPPKPRFSHRLSTVYPPREESSHGILAARRRHIKRALAESDGGLEYPKHIPDVRERHHSDAAVLDMRDSPPPLPTRNYDVVDLEPTTSAFTAFTPLEGQIATRLRAKVLPHWQESISGRRPSNRTLWLESVQKLYGIEENPDY